MTLEDRSGPSNERVHPRSMARLKELPHSATSLPYRQRIPSGITRRSCQTKYVRGKPAIQFDSATLVGDFAHRSSYSLPERRPALLSVSSRPNLRVEGEFWLWFRGAMLTPTLQERLALIPSGIRMHSVSKFNVSPFVRIAIISIRRVGVNKNLIPTHSYVHFVCLRSKKQLYL